MSTSPGRLQRVDQHTGSADKKFGLLKKFIPNEQKVLRGDIA